MNAQRWDTARQTLAPDPWLHPPTQADRDLAAACGVQVDASLAGAPAPGTQWTPAMAIRSAAALARREAKGRRRAPVATVTLRYSHQFKPRHCAGTTCFHSHPGQVSARPSVTRRSA